MIKVGRKARKKARKSCSRQEARYKKRQEHRTQGVRSNKVSRLCYKAEPGTLSHYMPSSSWSRRQRYQVIWWLVMILDDLLHLLVVYSLHYYYIYTLLLVILEYYIEYYSWLIIDIWQLCPSHTTKAPPIPRETASVEARYLHLRPPCSSVTVMRLLPPPLIVCLAVVCALTTTGVTSITAWYQPDNTWCRALYMYEYIWYVQVPEVHL